MSRTQETRLLDQIKKLHLEPGDSVVVSNKFLLELLMQSKWHTTFPINIIFAKDGELSKADIPALEAALEVAKSIRDSQKKIDQSGSSE